MEDGVCLYIYIYIYIYIYTLKEQMKTGKNKEENL